MYAGMMEEKFSAYVLTSDDYTEAHKDSPVFSVDCEMCVTTAGKPELTRICIVDSDLKVIISYLLLLSNR